MTVCTWMVINASIISATSTRCVQALSGWNTRSRIFMRSVCEQIARKDLLFRNVRREKKTLEKRGLLVSPLISWLCVVSRACM